MLPTSLAIAPEISQHYAIKKDLIAQFLPERTTADIKFLDVFKEDLKKVLEDAQIKDCDLKNFFAVIALSFSDRDQYFDMVSNYDKMYNEDDPLKSSAQSAEYDAVGAMGCRQEFDKFLSKWNYKNTYQFNGLINPINVTMLDEGLEPLQRLEEREEKKAIKEIQDFVESISVHIKSRDDIIKANQYGSRPIQFFENFFDPSTAQFSKSEDFSRQVMEGGLNSKPNPNPHNPEESGKFKEKSLRL